MPGRIVKDRADLDYIRVFVGKANVVGVPLAHLPLPAGFPVHLLHVRRYDADLVPAPDLTLEFGDPLNITFVNPHETLGTILNDGGHGEIVLPDLKGFGRTCLVECFSNQFRTFLLIYPERQDRSRITVRFRI